MNILKKLTDSYLKLNKKRTLVTIIGIILSGAMISAVTTLAVSFQGFMINYEKDRNGEWEARFNGVAYSNLKYIENNNQISDTFIASDLYMAENEYSRENYLKIVQYEEDAIKKMGEQLEKGELPKNSDEIALSRTFFDGKDNEPEIGDTVTFKVGYVKDVPETTDNPYGVEFVQTGTKTYKITGMIKRPFFESSADYFTAGITIMDKSTLIDDTLVTAGVVMKKSQDVYTVGEELAKYVGASSVKYNKSLLAYEGVTDDLGFHQMMYSVCGVLICIIMVGSVMVIYNSFAISVSDRKKQFGMLASVGATRKQIRKSVIYEGAILGCIGIPIGILCGIGGIGVTLKIVSGLINEIVKDGRFNLELVISWPAIIIAVILMMVTIYLSVIIPARRASKTTPIEAIRQVDDIKTKTKKLRTPKFITKLFGVEGTIALKNLKRAKKRYRTTVISLVVSIVLYISVTGFVDYMYTGFDSAYQTTDYDFGVTISYRNDNAKEKVEKAKNEIIQMEQIDRISDIRYLYKTIELPESKVNANIVKIMKENHMVDEDLNNYVLNTTVVTLNPSEYEKYLREMGLTKLEDNQMIIVNYINNIVQFGVETNVINMKEGEKLDLLENTAENQDVSTVSIAKLTEKAPFGISTSDSGIRIVGIVNENTYTKMLEKVGSQNEAENIYINTKNNLDVTKQLKEISNNYPNLTISVYDAEARLKDQRNLKLIIQIFLYGFIALISAIGISNIFNTISTNIGLRKREFANLKSIGMTSKQFNRMLNLECIFYGSKALLYGLPIGILMCYVINQSFDTGISMLFRLPWSSIVISIVAVYAIVFVTMLYSSKKMKGQNIVEALRDDNV